MVNGMIRTLSLDLETRSSADLAKCGVYRYSESPDFEILLFGVSADGGPVTVYDLASGEQVPEEILAALSDPAVTKFAYNAGFERVCLSAWLRRNHPRYFRSYGSADDPVRNYLDPSAWRCSLVLAAYNGLPLSLEKAGAVLGLAEQKLKEGRDLVRFFCTPSGIAGRKWNRPQDAPEKWALFKRYNRRDVEVELKIQERLRKYPVPDPVWDEYHLSEAINDRGIRIDSLLVQQAISIDGHVSARLTEELRIITGLENPNSVAQLKGYLTGCGMQIGTLGKKDVSALLRDAPDDLAEVLSLRQQLAKSSVKKYAAIRNSVCADGRCRGMFFFYGANRTGRFAGRIVQLQNLPQNHLPDLAEARDLVRQGDLTALEARYESVPAALSELVRTAFVPAPGYQFVVCDFSAIEARVLSWLAGERWRTAVFHSGRDIYCESASRMFGVPVEKNGRNAHLRQKGKIAELALGYGGSVGALKAMGALEMGLSETELQSLVTMWRNANPRIVQYWWDVDRAVKNTLKTGIPEKIGCVLFEARSGMLFIRLPGGRRLSYVKPRLCENSFGGESVTYMGTDAQKKWSRIESYGPKFVENITQAVSRDILCHAMKTLAGRRIVAHVHDELIIECPPGTSAEEICAEMSRTPPWLPGLELKADEYTCAFYRKQ